MRDVVIKILRESDNRLVVQDYDRGSLDDAKEFCRRPPWPAKRSDHFVAVDNWGGGTIVAATPSMSNWIDKPYRELYLAVH